MIARGLLAASAAAIIAGLGVTAAMAQGVNPDLMFAKPYVAFGAGLNFTSLSLGSLTQPGQTDSSIEVPGVTSSTDLATGTMVYGAVGFEPMPGIRTEGELSYRQNFGARFNVSGEGFGTLGVNASTFLAMANIWKDFGLSDGFGVHVGGGLGVGETTLTLTGGSPSSISHTGLALMAGVGLDYAMPGSAILTLDYRVTGLTGSFPSNTITAGPDTNDKAFNDVLSKSVDQSITVGLRVPFGG